MNTVYVINNRNYPFSQIKSIGILTLKKTHDMQAPKLDRGPDRVTANQDVHVLTPKSSSILSITLFKIKLKTTAFK